MVEGRHTYYDIQNRLKMARDVCHEAKKIVDEIAKKGKDIMREEAGEVLGKFGKIATGASYEWQIKHIVNEAKTKIDTEFKEYKKHRSREYLRLRCVMIIEDFKEALEAATGISVSQLEEVRRPKVRI